ncbi:MAG: terpene cyclase/mutase family protein [Planctomycetaceae bacterium]|nr:terpene cyclase/mutase family protein [Planctomycetaceae bacterium]
MVQGMVAVMPNEQTRFCCVTCRILLIAVCMLISNGVVMAQDGQSVIAANANLSAALPPGEWTRVEAAVDRGLEWLSSQQMEDGRFPSDDIAQPAVTSFAVMAFLSRGHLPGQGRYGAQLEKAIDFVLSTQRQRGYFSLLPVTPPSQHLTPSQTVTYNHAIAGLMLGEVYGMTSLDRSQQIEEAMARALIYHREVQSREKKAESDIGGWRYGYPEGPDASSDMSVTGWALMFLRSARNAEFNVPKSYFDEGLDFVERCYEADPEQQKKGVFRYRPLASAPNENPQITLANTASAMLTLILGGRHEHEGVAVGVDWFLANEYPRPWQNGYFYLASYYSSQAMAQVGGDTWNRVFPQIARSLIEEQQDEGHWPPGTGTERRFGSCYSTSLAVLALTPAYQLLPIYQR